MAAGAIDEYTFLMMIEQLDVNHDGIISKEEFKIPYMRLKKDLTDAQYDVLTHHGSSCMHFIAVERSLF